MFTDLGSTSLFAQLPSNDLVITVNYVPNNRVVFSVCLSSQLTERAKTRIREDQENKDHQDPAPHQVQQPSHPPPPHHPQNHHHNHNHNHNHVHPPSHVQPKQEPQMAQA